MAELGLVQKIKKQGVMETIFDAMAPAPKKAPEVKPAKKQGVIPAIKGHRKDLEESLKY